MDLQPPKLREYAVVSTHRGSGEIDMMDRREFFTRAAIVLGSVALPIGCGSSGGDESGSDEVVDDGFTLPDLSRNRFDDNMSTVFSVTHDSLGVIDMMLTEVDDEIFSPDTDQFSISLTGPDAPLLDEGTYQIYNASMGYFELYLQPGSNGGGTQNYRAIFSLLH